MWYHLSLILLRGCVVVVEFLFLLIKVLCLALVAALLGDAAGAALGRWSVLRGRDRDISHDN